MMNDKELSYRACWWAMVGIVLCLLLSLLTACTTTRVVTVERVKTDTLLQTRVQHDSLVLRDSIHIKEKGDTVWIERWHTRLENHLTHDTVYQSRTDSIPVPYEVVKEVPRQRGWLEKTLLGIGGMALLALIVGIVVKLKKYLPF